MGVFILLAAFWIASSYFAASSKVKSIYSPATANLPGFLLLDAASTLAVVTSLLAVIATIGVAFAVVPAAGTHRTRAVMWTWHRVATAVARGCGFLTLLASSSLVTETVLPIGAGNGQALGPPIISLLISLLAVTLASAIASWQDVTGYGQWVQNHGRASSDMRIARAVQLRKGFISRADTSKGISRRRALFPHIGIIIFLNLILAARVLSEFDVAAIKSGLTFFSYLVALVFFLSLSPLMGVYLSLKASYIAGINGSPRGWLIFAYMPALFWSAITIGALVPVLFTPLNRSVFQWLLGALLTGLISAGCLLWSCARKPVVEVYSKAVDSFNKLPVLEMEVSSTDKMERV